MSIDMNKLQDRENLIKTRSFKSFGIFYGQVMNHLNRILIPSDGEMNCKFMTQLKISGYTITSDKNVFMELAKYNYPVVYTMGAVRNYKDPNFFNANFNVFAIATLVLDFEKSDQINILKTRRHLFDDRLSMDPSDPDYWNHVIDRGHHKFEDPTWVQ